MGGAIPLREAARSGEPNSAWKSVWLALGLLVVIGGSVAAFLLRRQPREENSFVAASKVSPEMREIDSTVTTSGTVRLRTGAEVRVGSQVSGIVRKLNVTVGSHIQKGEIIAEIDPRPLEARVDQARAQARMDEVGVAKAQRDLNRGRQLFADGVLPAQQEEDLEWQMKSAQAKLEKSKSDLAAAEIDLSYAVIRAPITGTVASVSTQEGETVAASFAAPTFVTIIEDNALELVAMVDETDIANVRAGDGVVFTVEAYPSREMRAIVKRIDPVATIISGVVNYPVKAAIESDERILKPDMTANITIKTAERRVLVLPNEAIQMDGEERFVLVMKDGTEVKRTVMVGTREGGLTEIKRGLAAGEQVVVVRAHESSGKGEQP
ncbi:MAG TPA: efflux RND transporter periplasmic adaptor subunit [Candidatus Solibacter sp.]|nr:efflux RND transporter periplasmic adaptor subunit [Candidatus Solibacter sp.]